LVKFLSRARHSGLLCGLSLGLYRHEDRARRTLCDARRRVFERGLYSSKALLPTALVIDAAEALSAHGIAFGELK
jgi:hypothetical protein